MFLEFEVEITKLIGTIRPTFERLSLTNRIPNGAKVEAVQHWQTRELAELYCRCFPEPLGDVLRRMHGEDDRVVIDLAYSYALSLGREVLGFVLVLDAKSASNKFVYAVGVSPTHRKGWANAVLKHETLQQLRRREVMRIRFEADAGKLDAMKHARKSLARIVATYD